MNNYVLTHCHSTYSVGDSTTQPELLINRAKELGMKAIAFTEHGNAFNWIKKKQLCDKAGIKFIFGIEVYLTRTLKEKVRDNYHTILLAKNLDGVKEINELIYKMNEGSHAYYSPRLSFEEFCNLSNNVITTSACLGSPLNALEEEDEWFYPLIERYDYLEIQPHNTPRQKKFNEQLIFYAEKYGKPLISGTDTHEIDAYHKECRIIYMIGRADANGRTYYDDASDFDLSFKTYDELIEMYEQQGLNKDIYIKAIENTNIVADMIEDFSLDTTYKYPDLYDNPFNSLRTSCYDRLNYLINIGVIKEEDCDTYIDRIESEIEVFETLDMGSFMLYKHNNSLQCWDNGIIIGDGRGSVTGSLVAYLLRITDVDPIKWKTNFARFCNVNRYSLGDIDTDISPDQRQMAYDFIQKDFTKEKSAYIITFQKMKIKSIIDYVCRALKIPREKMLEIKSGYGVLEKKQFNIEKQYKAERIQQDEYEYQMAEVDKEIEEYISQFEDIFYYYKGINGTINSIGQHACGIIGSPITLKDNLGIFYNEKSKTILSQCDMKCVDSVNYVKYDMLSLKTLQVLRETYEMVGKKYPLAHEIDWNDQKVFESIAMSPAGIFQFEAINSFNRLCQFKPTTVQDIAFVTAIIRPSCATFADRAIRKELNQNPTQEINDLLSDTYQYLIYQEQIISFLQKICGFTEGEADVIRRAIGKKSKELLDEWLPKIQEGYVRLSSKSPEEATKDFQEFLHILINASDYGFSYNHAIAYSMITYRCAYARYYYPKEFITAYLNNATNDEDIVAGTKLAEQLGIEIVNPKFGYSIDKYRVKEGKIYKGIESVINISSNVAIGLQELYDNLENKNMSILELFEKTEDLKDLNLSKMLTLIKIDYFSAYGKAKKLAKAYEIYRQYYNAKIVRKDGNVNICKICKKLIELKYDGFSETKAQYKVNGKILVDFIINKLKDEDYTPEEKIVHQLSYLNYIQDKELTKKRTVGVVLFKSFKNSTVCIKIFGQDRQFWYVNESNIKDINKDDIILINSMSTRKNGKYTEKVLVDIDIIELDRRKEKK